MERKGGLNLTIEDKACVLSNESIPVEYVKILGATCSERIDTMIKDLIYSSLDKLTITMSQEIGSATFALRDFMFKNV